MQAFQELGPLAKTLHIRSYMDDRTLGRRVLFGLNMQERRIRD